MIIQGSQAIASLGSGDGIDEKKNSVDLVTEYDVRVEELVKKELGAKYPGFQLWVLPMRSDCIETNHIVGIVLERSLMLLGLASP